jgi:hypothetical protein
MNIYKHFKKIDGMSDQEHFDMIYSFFYGDDALEKHKESIKKAKKEQDEWNEKFDIVYIDENINNYVTIDTIQEMINLGK